MGRTSGTSGRGCGKADAVILFVDQYMTESADAQSLNLPREQDRLIEAVTRANPRTVVVLETGGPVLNALARTDRPLFSKPGTRGRRAARRSPKFSPAP